MDDVNDELIRRIRDRAEDSETRTDASPLLRGQSIKVNGLTLSGLDLGKFLGGDPNPTPSNSADPLSAPVGEALVAAAEKRLGFSLPLLLRQLYLQVANGGFGPGSGLMSLEEIVETYVDLIKTPPGPRGQKWPEHLLPFTRTRPGHDCIDLKSGEIIIWDEEELADGGSDKVWKRSFKKDTPTLHKWFERWLRTSSPAQQMQDMMQKGMQDSIRQSLQYWRAMTPAQRAAYGLPETGWEETLFGHLGIDLNKL